MWGFKFKNHLQEQLQELTDYKNKLEDYISNVKEVSEKYRKKDLSRNYICIPTKEWDAISIDSTKEPTP